MATKHTAEDRNQLVAALDAAKEEASLEFFVQGFVCTPEVDAARKKVEGATRALALFDQEARRAALAKATGAALAKAQEE